MKENMEERIKNLLKQMTLEEKAGQLVQKGPSIAGAFAVDFEELLNMVYDGKISRNEFHKMMQEAGQDYHEEELRAGKIGSYNGISDAAAAERLQKIAVEETRLGIPLLFGYDVIHGFRTVTPIPLAESCAWEPELWEKTARMSAKEASAGGVHMTFAPMVDVARDARWGRISEGAGEDAFLASCYGAAKVKGFQGEDLTEPDTLAACAKHFAAYGKAEAGRDYNRVDLSMQSFFEEYLPPFEACIKAGVRGIMPAFNDINGVPCSLNRWLLTDLLRTSLGFDGMTISDSGAIAECIQHGCAKDQEDAAKQALSAGMDMDMASGCYGSYLAGLVRNGRIEEELLDKAAGHVLKIKFELGLFEHPYRTSIKHQEEAMLKTEYRKLAREAARKSMVLLKNENILPLQKGIKLGIIGSLAALRGEMTGTWAVKADEDDCVSILDACEAQNIAYLYADGTDREELLKLAEESDVLLAVLGESKNQSGEAASRADITLPPDQMELLKIVKDLGKPAAAVLFNGRPLAIPWVSENIPAVLEAWHPGVEAGNAVLDILFGAYNPSGKLTASFPYAAGQCPIYYSHINTGRPAGKSKFTSKYLDSPVEPAYPFGYGLSYTVYAYTDFTVKAEEQAVFVSVKVKNTGSMDGEEIVQCYMQDLIAKRARPVKQLVDFRKVFLKAGEEQSVSFMIPIKKMGYYDMDMQYVVEDGEFAFSAGRNSADCLSQIIQIKGRKG